MDDTEDSKGYSLTLDQGKVHVNFSARWLDDALRVETESSVAPGWHHVMFTYDGSRVADGVKIYVDGQLQELKVDIDDLNQSFDVKDQPFRIGGRGGPQSRFHGSIEDVRIYKGALSAAQVEWIATPDRITSIAAISRNRQTPAQAAKIRQAFLETAASSPIKQARARVEDLQKQVADLNDRLPTTMVMQEMAKPRDSFVLVRGAYDHPGEKVGPGIPVCFPDHQPVANRLDFARWLVSPSNPLTARVAVNRYWQMYFGAGIVKTVDDFGSQGEWPTHPELLDWLATEFMRTKWDVKTIQKTIVTSATYRQASSVTPELLQRDPENRLLARGPRVRLSAEMVRDQALFASGLLVERIGGPSVRPYQPAGLWKELGSEDYVQSKGPDLYRRSLYTFWKRTSPPPEMATFDASARETCVVRETRTDTPLQALTLMNDVSFVEASRALAQRIIREERTSEARLALALELVTGRKPGPAERATFLSGFERYLRTYRADPKAAVKLISAGDSTVDKTIDPSELAAYTVMASLVLNLDEAVTKE